MNHQVSAPKPTHTPSLPQFGRRAWLSILAAVVVVAVLGVVWAQLGIPIGLYLAVLAFTAIIVVHYLPEGSSAYPG